MHSNARVANVDKDEAYFDEDKENIEFEEITKISTFSVHLLELYMKMCRLTLSSSQPISSSNTNKNSEQSETNTNRRFGQVHYKNVIRYDRSHEAPKALQKYSLIKRIWSFRYTRLIGTLLIDYITIKLIFYCVLQFQHDRLLKNWSPRVKYNQSVSLGGNSSSLFAKLRSSNNECALIENIDLDSKNYDAILNLRYWLDLIGAPYTSVTGSSIPIINICALTPILYYYIGMAYFQTAKQRKLDYLHFLTDPLKERERIKAILAHLIDLILATIVNDGENSGMVEYLRTRLYSGKEKMKNPKCASETLEIKIDNLNSSSQLTPASEHEQFKTNGHSNIDNYLLSRSSKKRFELNRREEEGIIQQKQGYLEHKHEHFGMPRGLHFGLLLVEIYHKNLVCPSILTSDWLKKLLKLNTTSIILASINSLLSPVAVLTFMMFYEMYERAKYRFQLIECQQILPGSILVRDQIKAEPMKALDFAAYEEYDEKNPFMSILKVINAERHNYFTWRRCLFLIEIDLAYLILTFWHATYITFYVVSTLDKMTWANQIDRQVRLCINLLSERIDCKVEGAKKDSNTMSYKQQQQSDLNGLNKVNRTIIRSEFENHPLSPSFLAEAKRDEDIVRAMSISYLNYEIFRRTYNNFQICNNFLIIQMSIMAGEMLFVCYLIGIYIDYKAPYILIFSISYLVLLQNVYLLAASMKFAGIKRLMNNVIRLLALGTKNSMTNEYIMELWRRQLLGNRQLSQSFAVNLAGMSISYEKFLTFNAYLIAIILLLMRVTL